MGRQKSVTYRSWRRWFRCLVIFQSTCPKRSSPIRRWSNICLPHYFFLVLDVVFFFRNFALNKTEGWNNCCCSSFGCCFLKGLGHAARSIDGLHGAIGNVSEDSAPVGVFQSQWSRGTPEVSAEKSKVDSKPEKTTPWRWLEGAKSGFFVGFPGKLQAFKSKNMLKRPTRWFPSFSWLIWWVFGWMLSLQFPDAIPWRKVSPGKLEGPRSMLVFGGVTVRLA